MTEFGLSTPSVDSIRDQMRETTTKINDFLEFIPSSAEVIHLKRCCFCEFFVLKIIDLFIQTWGIIRSDYRVRQNYVVKFKDDDIDQSPLLIDNLTQRGCTTRVHKQTTFDSLSRPS
jgi:hypothetical protein